MSDNFQNWKQLKKIGQGGFGEVWTVQTDAREVLAAKYIKLEGNQVSLSEAKNEVAMLRTLSHKNIVRFVTARERDNNLVIFTEFIDGKDLSNFGRLDERQAVRFLQQICDGLHYLHNQSPPVLHRDLKGQNIMVTRDGTIKIIDFGLSIQLLVASGMQATDVLMTCNNKCGTLPFMAPELFSNNRFSVKSDVWALGITLYQMMNGSPPFRGMDFITIKNAVTGSGAPSLTDGCSSQLVDFYNRCTARNPGDRPPVRVLLEHAVFRQ